MIVFARGKTDLPVHISEYTYARIFVQGETWERLSYFQGLTLDNRTGLVQEKRKALRVQGLSVYLGGAWPQADLEVEVRAREGDHRARNE
jgi:hypothetical protein